VAKTFVIMRARKEQILNSTTPLEYKTNPPFHRFQLRHVGYFQKRIGDDVVVAADIFVGE